MQLLFGLLLFQLCMITLSLFDCFPMFLQIIQEKSTHYDIKYSLACNSFHSCVLYAHTQIYVWVCKIPWKVKNDVNNYPKAFCLIINHHFTQGLVSTDEG